MKVKKQKKTSVKLENDIDKMPQKESAGTLEGKPQKVEKEKTEERSQKEKAGQTEEQLQKVKTEKPGEKSEKERLEEKPPRAEKEGSEEKPPKAELDRSEETSQKSEKKGSEGKLPKAELDRSEETSQKEMKEKLSKETENITDSEPRKRGGKAKGIALGLAAVIVVVLAAGYVSVAKSYSTRFLPASQINGIDCSDMDAAEALARLTPSVKDYVLEVKGRDLLTGESGALLGRVTVSDVDMHYEGIQRSVESALSQQNEYRWIFSYLSRTPTSYSVAMTIAYDEEKAKSLVQKWDAFQAENMHEAQKAYISEYSEDTNSYQVIPRTISTRINAEQACNYIMEALYNYETELDLEAMGCYEETVLPDEKKLVETVNTANKWLGAIITYDWNGSEVVVDKQLLREWVSIVEDEPVLDAEQVRRFVKKQASANDTYGKTGSFTTVHGVKMNLYRASYGWKTDIEAETEELTKLIQEGSTVKREPSYSIEARKKGTNDIGDSYVEIDLTHQHLYLHYDGQTVLETDFVSGDMNAGNATPQGIFGITYKKLDAVLRGTDYETPVKYWMPFYGNYGMHDANWRRVFGGNIYLNNGSHGCVNLPPDKAATIFQYVSKGFPVICYYYEVDPLAGQDAPPAAPDSGAGQGNATDQNPGAGQGNPTDQPPGAGQGNPTDQNPGAGQGNPTDQNPGAGQGNSTPQDPGAGQGNPTDQNPGAGQGNPTDQNPGAGQGNQAAQDPGVEPGNGEGQDPGTGQDDAGEQNSGQGENNDEGQDTEEEEDNGEAWSPDTEQEGDE